MKKTLVKSPLRYPGGKSKAISTLVNFLPKRILEYREPMVGGGSLFIYLKQKCPDIKIRINDLNKDVYCFWMIAKENNDELVENIKSIKKNYKDGKSLYHDLRDQLFNNKISNFERATNFFILNRITFSGLTTSGGYSNESFKKRFTISSIERLSLIKEIMQDVIITNHDYSHLLNGTKTNVLIYLDPPYFLSEKSKLYGQNGNLHINFDHLSFKENVLNCKHNLLITYDNSITIKRLFSNVKNLNLIQLNFQYGMNNVHKGSVPKSKELIITNYKIQ